MLPIVLAMPLSVIGFSVVLIALLMLVAYIDFVTFRIPDAVSLAIFVTGNAAIGWINAALLPTHLAASVFAGFAFWLVGEVLFLRSGTEMLGIGDAKLFGAGAMWVGILGLPSVLSVAALTGIANAVIAKRHLKRVPFGPFIGVGVLTVWLYGPIGF